MKEGRERGKVDRERWESQGREKKEGRKRWPGNHWMQCCLSFPCITCVQTFLHFIWYISCCCSGTKSCPTLCDPMDCSSQGFSVLHYLQSFLKLMSIESAMSSNHLILCQPLFLPPSIFPSIRVFSRESAFHIRWPKYWSFSFSISPSNKDSELISFRTEWFDLHAVQENFQSLLQHHSVKASVLSCSGFFTVQLSCPYRTTGKTIAISSGGFHC